MNKYADLVVPTQRPIAMSRATIYHPHQDMQFLRQSYAIVSLKSDEDKEIDKQLKDLQYGLKTAGTASFKLLEIGGKKSFRFGKQVYQEKSPEIKKCIGNTAGKVKDFFKNNKPKDVMV